MTMVARLPLLPIEAFVPRQCRRSDGTRKTGYTHRADARHAARRLERVNHVALRDYRCSYCRCYHLTSRRELSDPRTEGSLEP